MSNCSMTNWTCPPLFEQIANYSFNDSPGCSECGYNNDRVTYIYIAVAGVVALVSLGVILLLYMYTRRKSVVKQTKPVTQVSPQRYYTGILDDNISTLSHVSIDVPETLPDDSISLDNDEFLRSIEHVHQCELRTSRELSRPASINSFHV